MFPIVQFLSLTWPRCPCNVLGDPPELIALLGGALRRSWYSSSAFRALFVAPPQHRGRFSGGLLSSLLGAPGVRVPTSVAPWLAPSAIGLRTSLPASASSQQSFSANHRHDSLPTSRQSRSWRQRYDRPGSKSLPFRGYSPKTQIFPLLCCRSGCCSRGRTMFLG